MSTNVKVGEQVVGRIVEFHAAVHPADGVHEIRSISPCDATTKVPIQLVDGAVYDPFAPADPPPENPNRAARRRRKLRK